MFGRSRRTTTVVGADRAGHSLTGYVAVPGVEARRDDLAERRVATLMGVIGAGLAGHSGQAMGYDRGDPATSLTAPITGVPTPTDALALIAQSKSLQALPQPEYGDAASVDPALDGYSSILWRRMVATQ